MSILLKPLSIINTILTVCTLPAIPGVGIVTGAMTEFADKRGPFIPY
jgi:hypothetical protein